MWLITTIGFFSVVQKPGETDLTVRSRVASDLDELRSKYLPELGPTLANEGTDYPFRAKVGHEPMARAVAQLVRDIDYGNFKDEVTRRQGGLRHRVYAAVWSRLLQLSSH